MAPARPGLPAAAALRAATIAELFEAAGGLLDGHFLLKSGRHSERYLEKFTLLQHPPLVAEIGRRLADALAAYRPEVVVGPSTGGVLLAYEVARQLAGRGDIAGPAGTVRGIFAEPVTGGGRGLRRGFRVSRDERIAVVDDVLTTGGSLSETLEAVRSAGGTPLAAAVIVDRSPGDASALGVPLHALGRIELASWDPADCPACAAGAALVRPGS